MAALDTLDGLQNPLDLFTQRMQDAPNRAEVMQKRKLLDDAVQNLVQQQRYRNPGFDVSQMSASLGMMNNPVNPMAGYFGGLAQGKMSELQRQQQADVDSAKTGVSGAQMGTAFDQQDADNAMKYGQLAQQGITAQMVMARMYGQPEPVYDQSLNNGTGGFRYATKGELLQNRSLQPANTVPETEKSIQSPFGTSINKSTTSADRDKIKEAMDLTKEVNMNDLQQTYKQGLDVLNGHPDLSAYSMDTPRLNAINPFASLNATDTNTLEAVQSKLKAAAMKSAKNVRNLREYNDITGSGGLFGVEQKAALDRLHASYLAPVLQKQYADFLTQYQAKHNTLTGADEVWDEFLKNNPPDIRDKEGHITGINENALKPSSWSQYIDAAPEIYKQAREPQEQPQASNAAPEGTTIHDGNGNTLVKRNGQWVKP